MDKNWGLLYRITQTIAINHVIDKTKRKLQKMRKFDRLHMYLLKV